MIKFLLKQDLNTDMEELTIYKGEESQVLGFGNSTDDHCEHRLDALKEAFDFLGIKYEVEENDNWEYE